METEEQRRKRRRREEDESSLLGNILTIAIIAETFSAPTPSYDSAPSVDVTPSSDFGGFDGGMSGGGGSDGSF